MSNILNLDQAPETPVERIAWLGGVLRAVRAELETEFQEAYFQARIQGMFDHAIALRLHSRKRALAWTRRANEERGRIIKWGDGYSS